MSCLSSIAATKAMRNAELRVVPELSMGEWLLAAMSGVSDRDRNVSEAMTVSLGHAY